LLRTFSHSLARFLRTRLLGAGLLCWLHEVIVSLDNAHEVGIEGNDNDGVGDFQEDVVLLSEMDVSVLSWVVDSKVNNILLVEVVDVDEGEDALEDNGNNHEHASGHELSSGGVSISGEENNEEGACDDDWDIQHKVDHWVVPGEVVVQNQKKL